MIWHYYQVHPAKITEYTVAFPKTSQDNLFKNYIQAITMVTSSSSQLFGHAHKSLNIQALKYFR